MASLRIGPGTILPGQGRPGEGRKGQPAIARPRSGDDLTDGDAPLPEQSIRRDNLLTRITEAHLPVVVLDAPAGYGKSTLLGQLAEEDQRPVSWIALNRLHDEPALLLGSLLGALLPPEELEENLLGGPLDHPAFLSAVVLPRLAR